MQNGEFEKNIQQKMEELHLTPSGAVWDKVELSLPEKDKRRRWLFFILLFGFLAGGSLLLWNKYNNGKEKMADSKLTSPTTISKDSTQYNNKNHLKLENKKTTLTTTADSNTIKQQTATGVDKTGWNENKILKNSSRAKIKLRGANETAMATDDDVVKANTHLSKTKRNTKIKITTSKPTAITTGDGVAKANRHLSKTKAKTNIKVREPSIGEDATEKDTIINAVVSKKNLSDSSKIVIVAPWADSAVIINKQRKKNTLITQKDTSTTIAKTSEKKTSKSKWIYGMEAAAGLSNIKANLFNPATPPPLNYSTGSGTVTNPQTVIPPVAPTKAIAFSVGFYVEKAFTNHWRFTTGLNYVFQSSSLETGAKEDSSRVFRFANNSISTNGGYYLTGNSAIYKNKSHLLEVPLLMEYSFSKKSPFYLQGGTSVGYLLQSNALVYNAGYNEYFTNAALYNKLMVSFTAGAGINLAQKTKLPFSIGYRFKYGINSLVKKSFGEQHFQNSLLYIKIPLKK